MMPDYAWITIMKCTFNDKLIHDMEFGFSDRRESVNNSGYYMCATLVQMCVAEYELAFLMHLWPNTILDKILMYRYMYVYYMCFHPHVRLDFSDTV